MDKDEISLADKLMTEAQFGAHQTETSLRN